MIVITSRASNAFAELLVSVSTSVVFWTESPVSYVPTNILRLSVRGNICHRLFAAITAVRTWFGLNSRKPGIMALTGLTLSQVPCVPTNIEVIVQYSTKPPPVGVGGGGMVGK